MRTKRATSQTKARAAFKGRAFVGVLCVLGTLWANPLFAAGPAPMENFGKIPLYFVENRGQTDSRVAFYVQGRNTTVYFTKEGITFRSWEYKAAKGEDLSLVRSAAHQPEPSREVKSWVLKLDFVGANPKVVPVGRDESQARISYFTGSRDQWKADLRTYSTIVYEDLWPGIDLIYSGGLNKLKYSFLVKAGADPNQIKMAYRGATSVAVDESGRLVVHAPVGGFGDEAPTAFQDVDGKQVRVAARFRPTPDTASDAVMLGFDLDSYDRSIPLLLDPAVLVYCGYVGGGDTSIAVDALGNAYITGATTTTEDSFPVTVGPDLTHNGSYDAFVAKVSADGTHLEYCGYIGGSDDDRGYGIAVDTQGNAYVTGLTESTEDSFPVTVGPVLTHSYGHHGFVAKISADGTHLEYCGYIGGSDTDRGYGIAVDTQGNAYVTGSTSSTEDSFPVTVGPDLTFNGGFTDVFVAKVNAAGTALLYCGYIGGLDAETGWGIAVDTQGNAYVTGLTPSTEDTFPVTVGPDLTFNGGTEDAFVAKINSTGSALEYCGYIGGDHGDYGYGIAVDALGNAYVTGGTISDEDSFPVTVGPDLTYNGSSDAYVAKVNANGTALDYCGYIGGHAIEYAKAIAVDAQGNAYVTGSTGSLENTFPVFLGPDLTYNGDHYDAFVAKINSTGSALEYCGYIGGDHGDYGYGIAVDAQGNAYVTGTTSSTEGSFPLTVGPGLTRNGSTGAFVAKIGNLHRFVESVHVNGNPVSEGCSITIDGFVLGDAIKLRIVARNTEAQPSPPLYNNITVSFPSYTGRAALNRVELDPAYTSSDLNYSEYFGSVVKGDGYADYVMVESASTDTWDVNEGEYVELYVEPDHYGTFVIQYRAAASSQSSWTSGWSYEPESSAVTDCLGFPTYSINVILQAPIPGENPAQGMLVYSGYIGGAGSESGNGIAVDALGNAYVVGSTASDEFSFPLTAGPDLTYNGEYYDAFVAKINATGTGLVYCTYIGGLCTDGGSAIAVDAQGNAYITGITYSDYLSFPITVGPEIGPLYDCDNDHTLVFVAKLDADGTGLSYCRYLFGQNNLSCCDVPGIAVDDQGNAYIVGDIGLLGGDNNLPTTVGPDLTYNGGTWNPFVVKVNADGTAIDYCGYVGSGKPGDIAVDRQGNAYVTWNNGLSRYFQGNIAKINADGTAFDYTRESIGGKGIAVDVYGNAYATGDGRVSKINADGTSVVYTMSQISGSAIAVDRHGSAYVTGSAEDGLPTYVGPDLIFNGDRDAFVAKINPDGTALKYCGYIGGDQYDVGLDIAVDARGNAYITGRTESTEDSFPVIVGPDLTFNGGTYDAFVAKIRYVPPLTLRPWIFGTLRLLLLPEDFE